VLFIDGSARSSSAIRRTGYSTTKEQFNKTNRRRHAKESYEDDSKRRTQANKLSKSGKNLSATDAKKVKGGTGMGAGKVSMNDISFAATSGAGAGKIKFNE